VNVNWRKSSYSMNGGECVEAANGDGLVTVRDTANRAGDVLVFDSASWSKFVAVVRGL